MAQNPDFEKLTAAQLRAVEAFASGGSIADAAEASGAGRRTVDRWKAQPEFQAALKQTKLTIYEGAIAVVVGACTTAAQTLEAICKNSEASDAARVSAAKALLETAGKAFVMAELEQRVKELEAMFEDEQQD